MSNTSGTVTIVFTDLVDSTRLLTRVGDERGRALFKAHRAALQQAAGEGNGREVKWTGDGLMVSFPSVADAVRCSVAMQQASRQLVEGEELSIRVGINVGEAYEDDEDFFGASVVVARRLCDAARAGQILVSDLVEGLLRSRRGFEFASVGDLDLKGLPDPVHAFEVVYDRGPRTIGNVTPYVGRSAELAELRALADRLAEGRGGVALVSGEPGIGKTRITEELASVVRANGGAVLWGQCYEGEWSAPFAPFTQALEAHMTQADPAELRADLEGASRFVVNLVGSVAEFADIDTDATLQPDEERYRLLGAVASFLEARATRQPILLVLDDLHWVDSATVAMLTHVARSTSSVPLAIVGTFRDAEVGDGHPLTPALGELPRVSEVRRVALAGLGPQDVGRMLSVFAEQDVPLELAEAIANETGGNPFFIRELVAHLMEEGVLFRDSDGRLATHLTIEAIDIPNSVKLVLERRVARLSADARSLLHAAAVFGRAFRFDVSARAAELADGASLDALDEVIDAQIVVPAEGFDRYRFAHALLRESLYDDLSPSRRVRMHRRVADLLEASNGEDASLEDHAEIADHYLRSRELPGADRGVEHAMVAADSARASGAFDESIRLGRAALDLCARDDARRGRLTGSLSESLAWAFRYDEAVQLAMEAADLISATEGDEATRRFLASACVTLGDAGADLVTYAPLADRGLELSGDNHDFAWGMFISNRLGRQFAAEDGLGIESDVPELRELDALAKRMQTEQLEEDDAELCAQIQAMPFYFNSRSEALELLRSSRSYSTEIAYLWCGLFDEVLARESAAAEERRSTGRISGAAVSSVVAARCALAIGNLDEGRRLLAQAWELAAIVPRGGYVFINCAGGQEDLAAVMDEDWEGIGAMVGIDIHGDGGVNAVQDAFAGSTDRVFMATILAIAARLNARIGRSDVAGDFFDLLAEPMQRAPIWAINIPRIVCLAAETLWLAERTEGADLVEWALREKVLGPDWRYPQVDGRLAMAQLSALRGDVDAAVDWFAQARTALAEHGARPMLAVTDHEEALMYARLGDATRARPLIAQALFEFDRIGMSGWIRRGKTTASMFS